MDKYLSIGNACNLKCRFCYNDLNRETNTFFEPLQNVLKKAYQIRNNLNHVTIVGGEPFMYPEIIKLLKYIKKLEFNHVWVVTNGTKLSDINFAANLYSLGINSLEFSIHAINKEMEEKITQRPGNNFIKREKGIKNIKLLNEKFNNKISLNSNTVINNINYKEIVNIIKYTKSLGIKKQAVSFMYNLKGLSDTNKDLFVKYSDVIEVLNKSDEDFSDISIDIDWLPYCMHKKINKIKYIIREEYSTKKYNKDYKDIDSKISYKTMTNECKKCKVYGKLCNGVFNEYVNLFGDKEFKAV